MLHALVSVEGRWKDYLKQSKEKHLKNIERKCGPGTKDGILFCFSLFLPSCLIITQLVYVIE